MKRTVRTAVCIALTLLLILQMPLYHREEAAHEWLGVALALLAIAHLFLHGSRLRRIARKKAPSALRLQLAVSALLSVSMAALVASGIMMSGHVAGSLAIGQGASAAREVHLAVSHLVFVLAGLHAGTHGAKALTAVRGKRAAFAPWARRSARMLAAAAAGAGLWQFFALGFPAYLTLSIRFGFLPPDTSLAAASLAFGSVFALFAVAGRVLIRALATRTRKSESAPAGTKPTREETAFSPGKEAA